MLNGIPHQPHPGQRLRRAFTEAPPPLRAVGVVNAIAAHVAAEAGFDALWISGLEVSAALGLPDANVLGVRDLTDLVSSITRGVRLPVIVDADNAGGSILTARRYACDLAKAGAAALCLEDSAYPKCNSFSTHTQQQLADRTLVCEQLAEMRRTVGDALVLLARTEALIAGEPLHTALNRARCYADAGAEAVVVHSKDPSGQQALAVAHDWTHPTPLVVIPTAFTQFTSNDFGEVGYTLCIYANHLSRAALAGMRSAAHEITRTGTPHALDLPSVGELLTIGEPNARACI